MMTTTIPTVEDELTKQIATSSPTYADRAAKLNSVYDAATTAAIQPIESAYQQSMATHEASAAKIPETYRMKANEIATQAEIGKRNFNESAAASGINVGAGSQVRLSQTNNMQKNLAALQASEAQALADARAQKAAMDIGYQSQIAAAIGNKEFERATALYNEYKAVAADERSMAEKAAADARRDAEAQATAAAKAEQQAQQLAEARAKTMAGIGDYSGYSALGYTPEQIAALQGAWMSKNAPKPTSVYPDDNPATDGGIPDWQTKLKTDAARQIHMMYQVGLQQGNFSPARMAQYIRTALARSEMLTSEANYLLTLTGN